MVNFKKENNDDSLADIAIDPDVLAKELAVELEIDPLEEIDNDGFSKTSLDVTSECDQALKFLKGNREERIQGLKIFCEYRDERSTKSKPYKRMDGILRCHTHVHKY